MRRSALVLTGILASVMVTVVAGDLASQTQGAALVEERQKKMKEFSRSFKVFMPIVKGENPKVSDAVETAQQINANAKYFLTAFPEGTGRDAIPESRAKPEVWTESAEFNAAADKMIETTERLAKAAETNDLEIFLPEFKAFATACGGCHEAKGGDGGKFRYPRE